MNLYICKCDEPEWSTILGNRRPGETECLACGGVPAEPPPPNYRGMEKPPVPFYALDSALVASMHAEIRALYSLLRDQVGWGSQAVQLIDRMIGERLVTERIEEES